MKEFDFFSPQTLDEACRLLANTKGKLISGGTDVIPQMRKGRLEPECLIDLSRLDNLRFIEEQNSTIRIGALTPFSDMLSSPLLQTEATALVQAVSGVGSTQTRHRGTPGGNIANASPAGDTLPPFLVLNAKISLASIDGKRTVSLVDLLTGPGKTAIAPNEVIHHIIFKKLPANTSSLFLRLGNRMGMAVSVASAAMVVQLGKSGLVEDVRIALGAVASTAIRCPKTEAVLIGESLTPSLIKQAAQIAKQECSPIDDVRGTADYRRHCIMHLVRRGLHALSEKSTKG